MNRDDNYHIGFGGHEHNPAVVLNGTVRYLETMITTLDHQIVVTQRLISVNPDNAGMPILLQHLLDSRRVAHEELLALTRDRVRDFDPGFHQ